MPSLFSVLGLNKVHDFLRANTHLLQYEILEKTVDMNTTVQTGIQTRVLEYQRRYDFVISGPFLGW